MINYIVMWQRDGSEGFDFVNVEDGDMTPEDSAIELWLKNQNGPHPDGRLFKMIITETSNTYKVPLDTYGYYYGVDKSLKRICEHCDGYGGQWDGFVNPSKCGYCDGTGVDK